MIRLDSKWAYKRRLLCWSPRFRPVHGKSRSPLLRDAANVQTFSASRGVANPNRAAVRTPLGKPAFLIAGGPDQKTLLLSPPMCRRKVLPENNLDPREAPDLACLGLHLPAGIELLCAPIPDIPTVCAWGRPSYRNHRKIAHLRPLPLPPKSRYSYRCRFFHQ
jgi:hypothetical protein